MSGFACARWREVMTYQNLLIDVVKNSDWRFIPVCCENIRSSSSLLLEEVEKSSIPTEKKVVLKRQLSEYDCISSQVAYYIAI